MWPTPIELPPPAYDLLKFGEILFYLALVDAAYSGDWLRIGIVTHDQELFLQEVLKFIAVAHSVVAAITVRVALEGGYPPVWAGVQGFLFGTLGLYDVHLRVELKKGN